MIVLGGPRRELKRVAFSPDGAEVAAAGGGPLHVWRDGRRTELVGDGVYDFDYTPDGRWLVYRVATFGRNETDGVVSYGPGPDDGLHAHDRRTNEPAGRLPGTFVAAVRGDRLLLRTYRPDTIVCRRVAGRPPFPVVWERPDEATGGAVLLADGRAVHLDRPGEDRRRVLVVRVAGDGSVLTTVPVPARYGVLHSSPAGDHLLLSSGTRVTVWRTDDWDAAPVTASLGRREVRKLVWHPSGAYLLGVGADGQVRRLDAVTWEVTGLTDWPGGKARAVAVAPDGLTAAVATSQGKVVLFDLD